MNPPLIRAEVKVTEVPEQMLDSEAVITRSTSRFGLTVMVIGADVAGEPVVHASLEVTTQLTLSPLTRDEEEKVAPFVPAKLPLTSHW